jgi:hypothetical protein
MGMSKEQVRERIAKMLCDDCFLHQKNHDCESRDTDSLNCYGYLATTILSDPRIVVLDEDQSLPPWLYVLDAGEYRAVMDYRDAMIAAGFRRVIVK